MFVKCYLMKMSLSKQSSSEGQRLFQVLGSQARQIVYKVQNFFKELKSQGRREEINLSKTQELTANASFQGSPKFQSQGKY